MDLGMLQFHRTVVILFLLFFLFKSGLLFADKTDLLNKIRSKTQWLDIALGMLILATGIYLFTEHEVVQTYLIIKFVLVLFALPLSIIGLKRNNKVTIIITLLLFTFIYRMSETKNVALKPTTYAEGSSEEIVVGKEIYINECAQCHGEKGNADVYGSRDLSIETISDAESIEIITHGRNVMPTFKNKLTKDQIRAVTAYLHELKK